MLIFSDFVIFRNLKVCFIKISYKISILTDFLFCEYCAFYLWRFKKFERNMISIRNLTCQIAIFTSLVQILTLWLIGEYWKLRVESFQSHRQEWHKDIQRQNAHYWCKRQENGERDGQDWCTKSCLWKTYIKHFLHWSCMNIS